MKRPNTCVNLIKARFSRSFSAWREAVAAADIPPEPRFARMVKPPMRHNR